MASPLPHDHDHDHSHESSINWERVQGWVQTGIMFLLALYLIDLSLPGGNLPNYINIVNFAWLTWVGAFILLAVAALNTYELLRQAEHDHAHHHHHDHEHDHGQAGSWASWAFLAVAAIPLVIGLGIPSESLGADAVGDLDTDIRAIGFGGSGSFAEIAPENRNLLDWVRAFSVSSDLSEFVGQPVNLTGFVYKDARFAGTPDFMLVRFTLNCCVADARPLGLIIEPGELAANFEQDTWLNIRGHIEIDVIDGVQTPVIIPESLEITPEPEQPYLYF
jgi:uncharacterized repeat protein (TIGR03943 family)